MKTIPVEILSDPICPWCYIAKARLDRALAARPSHPLRFFWRPFQLNPDMPTDGMDRRAYLERKFGGPDGAARVYGAIEATARDENLPVDFAAIARTPSTLDAHRVIRWAGEADPDAVAELQGALHDRLFLAYFCEARDISDRALLSELAGEIGLDADDVSTRLAGDHDRHAVAAEDGAARRAGVSGAPTFLVNARYVVPGAQDTSFWMRVIDELAEALDAETENAPPPPSA